MAALCPPLHAQGSRADYERSERFEELTRGKVFRERVDPQWLPGGERFWYRVDTGPGQHEFVLVDAGEGWRRPATSTATST